MPVGQSDSDYPKDNTVNQNQVRQSCDLLRTKNSHWAAVCARLDGVRVDPEGCARKRQLLDRFKGATDMQDLQKRHHQEKQEKHDRLMEKITMLKTKRDRLLDDFKEKKRLHHHALVKAKRNSLVQHIQQTYNDTISHVKESIETLLVPINQNKALHHDDYLQFKQLLASGADDQLIQLYGVDGVQEMGLKLLCELEDRPVVVDLREDGEGMVREFVERHGRPPVTLQKAILDSKVEVDQRAPASVALALAAAAAVPQVPASHKTNISLTQEILKRETVFKDCENAQKEYSLSVKRFTNELVNFRDRVKWMVDGALVFPFTAVPKGFPPIRVPSVDPKYFTLQALQAYSDNIPTVEPEPDQSTDGEIMSALVHLNHEMVQAQEYHSKLLRIKQVPLFKLQRINDNI